MIYTVTILIVLLSFYGQSNGQNLDNDKFVCSSINDLEAQEGGLANRCYYISEEYTTFIEAHDLCRRADGWLSNCLTCEQLTHFTVNPDILVTNGIQELWSGVHVTDRYISRDRYPVPGQPVTGQNLPSSEVDFEREFELEFPKVEDCTSQRNITTCRDDRDLPLQRRKRQTCDSNYQRNFSSCNRKLPFICYTGSNTILEKKIIFREQVQGVQLMREPGLLHSYFFSNKTSSYDSADSACAATLKGGKAFRFQGQEDRLVEIKVTLQEIYSLVGFKTFDVFENSLAWVSDADECTAIYLYVESDKVKTTWPCDTNLRVLCQTDQFYQEVSNTPEFQATLFGEVPITKTELLISSDNYLTLLRNNFELVEAPPIFPSPADLRTFYDRISFICELTDSSFEFGDQFAVGFVNGKPTFNLDTRRRSPLQFSFFEQSDRDYVSQPIKAMRYRSCGITNRNSKKLHKSNSVFVRLTDYDVYTLRVPLNKTHKQYNKLNRVFSRLSLQEKFVSGGFSEVPIETATEVVEDTQIFEVAFYELLGPLRRRESLWGLEPLLYTTVNGSQLFVMYVYKAIEFGPGLGSGDGIPPGDGDGIPLGDGDLPVNTETTEGRGKRQTNEDIVQTPNVTFDKEKFETNAREIRSLFQNLESENNYFNMAELKVLSIDRCWATEVTVPELEMTASLPDTAAHTTWYSQETCASDGKALVSIECSGDRRVGLQWAPYKINEKCGYYIEKDPKSEIVKTLKSISLEKMDNDTEVVLNLDTTVKLTKDLAEDPDVDKDDEIQAITYIADILQKASTNSEDLTPKSVQDILDIVDEVNNFPTSVLRKAQEESNATNRILQSIEIVGRALKLDGNSSTTTALSILSEDVALQVWKLAKDSADAPVIGLKVVEGSNTLELKDLKTLYAKENLDFSITDVAILLPKSFVQSLIELNDDKNEVRLAMHVYRDTSLFISSMPEDNTTFLGSQVIAAQLLVNKEVQTDLKGEQVKTVFLPRTPSDDDSNYNVSSCVYWDFSAYQGLGGWSSDGCRLSTFESGRAVCVCDHLTNFAVLMNYYDQEKLAEEYALTIITRVGLSLSIVGLAITIISFLAIKKLRKGRPQQTLVNLAFALLCSWVIFLAGIHQTSSKAGCIAVAALLHYFILASFMWMLMEGLLQYLLFVRVMNSYFTNYMCKTAIPAWLIPVIPVVIVFAVDVDLYKGGDHYCWMAQDAFYYAFAIPVGIIVLINLIIFVMVVFSLCKRKTVGSNSNRKSNTLVNIRASFICFCILGLTWIFGFLAIDNARLVFQYLFCIFGSLQGFFIFLMMTARDKVVRQFWRDLCCRCCPRKDTTSSSSSNTANKYKHRNLQDQSSKSSGDSQRPSNPTSATSFSSSSNGNGSYPIDMSDHFYTGKNSVIY